MGAGRTLSARGGSGSVADLANELRIDQGRGGPDTAGASGPLGASRSSRTSAARSGRTSTAERFSGRRGFNDGDRVGLGKFTLVFRCERAASAAIDVRDQASYAVAGQTIALRGPALDVRERACPYVGYLEEPQLGHEVPARHLLEKDFVLVGAASTAQVPVKGAADRAAMLVRTWQGFSLLALAPGVRRNREHVDLVTALQTGDEVAIGPASFRLHAGRPSEL